jgi:hypothetical protein
VTSNEQRKQKQTTAQDSSVERSEPQYGESADVHSEIPAHLKMGCVFFKKISSIFEFKTKKTYHLQPAFLTQPLQPSTVNGKHSLSATDGPGAGFAIKTTL